MTSQPLHLSPIVERRGRGVSLLRVARTAVAPLPEPVRRGPIVGLLLMTLLALALLGGMAYVFLNNGLQGNVAIPTPTIPVLTPPGPASPVPATPTLVPTTIVTPTGG